MTDDEEKIEYLFYKGYTYEEIVGLLSVDFGIQMSLSTLRRGCAQRSPLFMIQTVSLCFGFLQSLMVVS
jgi:hypothetical protein